MLFWQEKVLLLGHEALVVNHGGVHGVRDGGMLQSALGRPLQRYAYGETNVAALAAAYGYGIARNHPFVDGNKRTSWLAVSGFIRLQGFTLNLPVSALVGDRVVALASGALSESDFAQWLRTLIVK